MTTNLKKYFFLVLIIFPLFAYKEVLNEKQRIKIAEEKEGRLFLFTYPRSGTHWTYYILKWFSHRVITFKSDKSEQRLSAQNPGKLESDFSKPTIISTHIYGPKIFLNGEIYPPDIKNDKILIIVRNPVESIVRQVFYARKIAYEDLVPYFQKKDFELYNNLKFFETWPETNRLLIYYEDLISNPKNEIEKILDFINEPKDQLDTFIRDLPFHVAQSISFYDQVFKKSGGSITHGKNFRYHSEKMPPQVYHEILKVLKLTNPTLFDKYFATKYGF